MAIGGGLEFAFSIPPPIAIRRNWKRLAKLWVSPQNTLPTSEDTWVPRIMD
jgi:hypothetical protein